MGEAEGLVMLPVERFSPDTASFDEASTRRLGLAFDKACALLCRAPQPTNVREIVAKGIIEAAKQGERDVDRLRDAGLAPVCNYIVDAKVV
jgi:hypothetical protein